MSTLPDQIPIAVFETPRGFIIRADFDDTAEKEVRVLTRGDELTIAGHGCTASVRLPGTIDGPRIAARYSGSRLIVNVPLLHPERLSIGSAPATPASPRTPDLALSRG